VGAWWQTAVVAVATTVTAIRFVLTAHRGVAHDRGAAVGAAEALRDAVRVHVRWWCRGG
jgi:hypothetical protein